MFTYTLYLYSKHSVVTEKMQVTKKGSFNTFKKRINEGFAKIYTPSELDAKLRIAEYPMGLTGENYLGYLIILISGSFVVALSLAMTHVISWTFVPAIPFVFWAIPRFTVTHKYESNWSILRVNLMDFCARLEQGVSAGAQPISVFKKTAESDNLLGNEMKAVVEAQKLNKSLYKAFAEHFIDILHIPEADEIAVILKTSEERGALLSGPLKDLNRDFRFIRQTELILKASKIKPAVTIVLTISVMLATLIFIIGPILMELLKAL